MNADRKEGLRCCETDELIDLCPQSFYGLGRSDRHGEDQGLGAPAPQRLERRTYAGPSRDAVVDHDQGSSPKRHPRPTAEISLAPPLDLDELALGLLVDVVPVESGKADDVVIDDDLRL